MQLSKRLSAVADMVTPGNCLADVGTDHAYIPIYLVKLGRVSCALAMDVHKGPLKRAGENIKNYHLEDRICTRLSDGVSALQEFEADTVVMAGMGGGLVIKIMTEGREVLRTVRELILQPQSEIELVRRFLQREGYCIAAESMVLEDGKFYPMMRVVQGEFWQSQKRGCPGAQGEFWQSQKRGCPGAHGQMKLERQIEFKYGPILLKEKNDCLKAFLDKEETLYRQVLSELSDNKSEKAVIRSREIEDELKLIQEAKEELQ